MMPRRNDSTQITKIRPVTMVTGLIFVICVLSFRRGIIGELVARIR